MKVTFLGFGGHAGNLVDICRLKQYEIMGYIDDNVRNPDYIALDRVLGAAVLGFGGVTTDKLESRYKVMAGSEAHFITLDHPSAVISETAMFGDGVQVMAGAIVQHNVKVESASIINTGAIIEHDSVIGKGCHIAPGAVVLGDCTIGDFCFIGAGAIVVQGTKVPSRTFIHAGTVWFPDKKALYSA
jgi:acetyltransferase EpsM